MTKQALGLVAVLLAISALACGALPAGEEPTAAPTLEPTAGTGPAPTGEPATPAPGPTATPAAPAVLPAPLYFVNTSDQQIWRIEVDGSTRTQITTEPQPVDDFDVSPTVGAVVYVSGNSIYIVDPRGGNRRLLFQGPPLSQDDLNTRVGVVRWSPDGTRFVYSLSGVNVFDLAANASQVLLANDPIDVNTPGQYNLYFPESWSPDGTRLLIGRSLYATDAYWLSVLNLADSSLVDLQGRTCCYPTWSADGTAIYLANDQFGMFLPGLWRVDAATGVSTTLVQDMPDSADPPTLPIRLFSSPFLAADGQLYVFQGSLDAVPEEFGTNYPLTMHRANPDGSNAAALRSDSHVIGEALWARDASGAVIMDITSQVGPGVFPEYPLRGDLVWLPAGGSAATPLGITGRILRWGPGS